MTSQECFNEITSHLKGRKKATIKKLFLLMDGFSYADAKYLIEILERIISTTATIHSKK